MPPQKSDIWDLRKAPAETDIRDMSDLPHCSHTDDCDNQSDEKHSDHFAFFILAIAFRISTVAK